MLHREVERKSITNPSAASGSHQVSQNNSSWGRCYTASSGDSELINLQQPVRATGTPQGACSISNFILPLPPPSREGREAAVLLEG